MSGWDYEGMGDFGSENQAVEWARRNKIDPRDLHIKRKSEGVEVSLRSSADKGEPFDDSGSDRRDGF